MYRNEYDKALKESAKFKSKGLRLDETRWYDVFEETIEKARRWDEAKKLALTYPWVKNAIEIIEKSDSDAQTKDILTNIIYYKENETKHLYNLIAVMASTDSRQLEVNLKRKIIDDLGMFFKSGFYTGKGYQPQLQEFLDMIYEQMRDWFFTFDAGEISDGNES